jgi:hypothetical protein
MAADDPTDPVLRLQDLLIDDGGQSQKAVSRTAEELAGTVLPLYFNSDHKLAPRRGSAIW